MKRKAPSIHQLENFQINEVSLVDRGANKRRYVVVKRDQTMTDEDDVQPQDPGTANVSDSAGAKNDAATTVSPAPAGPSVEDASTPKDKGDVSFRESIAELRALVADLTAKNLSQPAPLNEPKKPDGPVDAAVKLEKRLERLEKSISLPNSLAEDTSASASDAHVWAFDLNAKSGKD